MSEIVAALLKLPLFSIQPYNLYLIVGNIHIVIQPALLFTTLGNQASKGTRERSKTWGRGRGSQYNGLALIRPYRPTSVENGEV